MITACPKAPPPVSGKDFLILFGIGLRSISLFGPVVKKSVMSNSLTLIRPHPPIFRHLLLQGSGYGLYSEGIMPEYFS